MKVLVISALVFALAQFSLGKPSLTQNWESFKTTHNKQYNVDEESYRKVVFAANLAKINKHNEEHAAGKQTWTMGVNHLSDLTHEEFMERNKLKVPDMPKQAKKYQMQAKTMAAQVDWRDKGYVTDVKDQGQCGSCWAFGAIASLEAAQFEKHGSTVQMSDQQVVDCDNQNSGCNGGWYDTAWQYIKEEGGVTTTAAYPYHAKDETCKASQHDFVSTVSGCYGGPNYYCDNGGKVADEAVLKEMLNDRPIAVAVDATPFQFYNSGLLDCRSFHQLNHAVFAVGYGTEGSDDYWIIKNSWGAAWGEDGYVRVKAGGNPCGVADYPSFAIAA